MLYGVQTGRGGHLGEGNRSPAVARLSISQELILWGGSLLELFRFGFLEIGEHCPSDTDRQSSHEDIGNDRDDEDPNIYESFDKHFH